MFPVDRSSSSKVTSCLTQESLITGKVIDVSLTMFQNPFHGQSHLPRKGSPSVHLSLAKCCLTLYEIQSPSLLNYHRCSILWEPYGIYEAPPPLRLRGGRAQGNLISSVPNRTDAMRGMYLPQPHSPKSANCTFEARIQFRNDVSSMWNCRRQEVCHIVLRALCI